MATEFKPKSADDVLNEDIRSSLSLSVDQVKDLSTAAQLNELEKICEKLQANASPESVEQATDRIAEALGLVEGPVPNPIPPEGVFDISTAQIHDITRNKELTENGRTNLFWSTRPGGLNPSNCHQPKVKRPTTHFNN